MEKTLKLPRALSLFHELQVQALPGSEVSSHNDGGGSVATDCFLHPQRHLTRRKGAEKKTPNIFPVPAPGSQAEVGESISYG